MDRTPWLAAQGIGSYDLNNMSKDPMKGLGWLAEFLLGETGDFLHGFQASETSTPSLSVSLLAGQIYQYAEVDGSPIGTFAADSMLIEQQGYADAQSINLNTSALSAGQSQWWLIQGQFEQVDQVRDGDVTEGNRPFYNSQDPSDPLDGQNGQGGRIATVRLGFANITAIEGAAAITGSHVPPQPSSGCVPMYLIQVAFGDLAITNEMIQVAGPGAYAGYPQAPFLAGLLKQHHLGIAGTAPKLDVTKEIQGRVPFSNLIVTNPTPAAQGTAGQSTGTLTGSPAMPILNFCTANPNGQWAGIQGDFLFCLANSVLYICSQTGIASGTGQAVWTPIGSQQNGSPCQYANTSPYDIVSPFITMQVDASGGNMVQNMPTVASAPNGQITVAMCVQDAGESNTVTVQPASGSGDKFIYRGQFGLPSIALSRVGESRNFRPLTIPSGANAGNYWLVT